MTHASDFADFDFVTEINELYTSCGCNFGKDAIPVEIIKGALLKNVCGYYNGSTANALIRELGLVKRRKSKVFSLTRPGKLTAKGKAFLWWAFDNKQV